MCSSFASPNKRDGLRRPSAEEFVGRVEFPVVGGRVTLAGGGRDKLAEFCGEEAREADVNCVAGGARPCARA